MDELPQHYQSVADVACSSSGCALAHDWFPSDYIGLFVLALALLPPLARPRVLVLGNGGGVLAQLVTRMLPSADVDSVEQDGAVSDGGLGLLSRDGRLVVSRGDRVERVRRALAEEVVGSLVAGVGVEEDQVRPAAIPRRTGVAGVGGEADEPAEAMGFLGNAAAVAVVEAEAEDGAGLIRRGHLEVRILGRLNECLVRGG